MLDSRLITGLLVACCSLAACGLRNGASSSSGDDQDFAKLQVSPDFGWSGSSIIDLEVSLAPAGRFEVNTEGAPLVLWDEAGATIARAFVRGERAHFQLKAPPTVESVRLYFPGTHNVQQVARLAGPVTMDVAHRVYGQDNGLEYAFAAVDTGWQPRAKLAQAGNLVRNGDFTGGSDLPYVDSYDAPLASRGVWHKTRLPNGAWEPAIRNGQLDLGHPQLAEPSAVLQDIDVNPGRDVTLGLLLKQPAANEGLRADIVLSALDGDRPGAVIAMLEIDAGAQDYKVWTPVVISGTVPAWANGVRIMIVSLPSTKKFYVDTAVEVDYVDLADTGAPADTDSDGVVDALDQAATDPDLAVFNLLPYAGYTVNAFEDMWPEQGDYDFNDVVVQHKIEFARDGRNRLVRADVELVINALGAVYHNGLALRFLASQTDGETITYTPLAAGLVADVADEAEGLDPLAPNTVIITEDVFSVLDVYYQNNGEGPSGGPKYLSFRVTFDRSHPAATAPVVPELFIFRTGARGHEIHLPGYPATAAADAARFGTLQDASDPSSDYWYRTATGLPWALEIVPGEVQFRHPRERISILDAFPGFSAWARSSGSQERTWYANPRHSLVYAQ